MANIEVAFATPDKQVIVEIPLTPELSAREAVERADLASRFSHFSADDFTQAPLGIFGERLRDPEHYMLSPGERVEVYRPLKVDPKQARRNRAARTFRQS